MLCPKCYTKINKDKNRCDYCGFNINDLKDASNKKAKKALHSPFKDDVLFTSQLPNDVSKKKLMLFSIFLGLFGVHNFYVGKIWQGLYNVVVTSLVAVLGAIIIALKIITNTPLYIAFQFLLVFQGINVIWVIVDIFNIIFNRYKVPVYKESLSK